MTYSTEIAKNQALGWAELYKFQVGGDSYYYTSHGEEITYQTQKYSPRPIKRGSLEADDKPKSDRINITMPLSSLAIGYIANAPVEPVIVTITRIILNEDQDAYHFFKGRVENITIQGVTASIDCEGGAEVFRNAFPSQVYQSRCQWSLFDGGCGLLESNFETLAVVTVSGSSLVSSTFATKPNGYFTMGYVKFGNNIRMITNHVTNTITIQVPFDARLATGMTVKAYPGDDKSFATCRDKFNNVAKFTGFKFIPASNPVIWGFK